MRPENMLGLSPRTMLRLLAHKFVVDPKDRRFVEELDGVETDEDIALNWEPEVDIRTSDWLMASAIEFCSPLAEFIW